MDKDIFYDLFKQGLSDMLNTVLNIFITVLINCFPVIIAFIGVSFALSFFKHLITPKYDGVVFDEAWEDSFSLSYDTLSDFYDDEDDFINDYLSDFTYFSDEIEPDYDGPVFDEDWEEDFELSYDILSDEYQDEDDFINDYMSDFSSDDI